MVNLSLITVLLGYRFNDICLLKQLKFDYDKVTLLEESHTGVTFTGGVGSLDLKDGSISAFSMIFGPSLILL